MKWLKRLLKCGAPPEIDKNGDTICYCGNKTFSAFYGYNLVVIVECHKCKHWWWEL
jgi:hypothetical protein